MDTPIDDGFTIWSEDELYQETFETEVVLIENWYFELFGKVYGPFETKQQAILNQNSMIDDLYQDETEEENG